jgi:hypothetical protein
MTTHGSEFMAPGLELYIYDEHINDTNGAPTTYSKNDVLKFIVFFTLPFHFIIGLDLKRGWRTMCTLHQMS